MARKKNPDNDGEPKIHVRLPMLMQDTLDKIVATRKSRCEATDYQQICVDALKAFAKRDCKG